MRFHTRIRQALQRQSAIGRRLEAIQEALGRIESRQHDERKRLDPRDYEFKVYSQWGEDGIIDHLVSQVSPASRTFVEFGVENYTEANTLFLLKHRNWRGLVIDGSAENIQSIRASEVYWRYDLRADAEFITRENINDIITRNGLAGELGVLSIDIDGNDYWIWDAITCVRPTIVVAEYNSLFGPLAKVSVPYASDFFRTRAHASNMYYGASLGALDHLARRRGYSLVAGNSAGNNAFFVRDDCLGAVRRQTVADAYRQSAFREARSDDGSVALLAFSERQAAIASLPVVDVTSSRQMPLKEVL